MHLRQRHPDDIASCVEIMRRTHHDSAYPIYWPDDPAGFLGNEAELKAWVAVDPDNGIVGHVALHRADEAAAMQAIQAKGPTEAEGYAVVSRLLVHPQAQGHGLGKRLLDTAVDYSVSRGQHPILVVTKNTPDAIQFYEALGWNRIGSMTVELPVRPDIEMWVYTAP